MLQEIVNAANVGFVVIGADLQIRLWNEWMTQATGVSSEIACYQRVDQLLPQTFTPDLIEKVESAIRDGVATMIPQTEGNLSLLSRPVDISIQPLKGRHYVHSLRPFSEETVDHLCLLQFRTVRAGAETGHEAPLATMFAGTGAADHARLDFLATIGHQIRTPVHGVLGVAELLRETPLSPTQRKYTDLLVRAGQSLQAFVNDLTDLAYLEAGRTALEHETTDLPCLVQDVMDIFATAGSTKGIRAVVELVPGLPKYILTDHQKLRQILVILLGNAFKFTHEGSVTLRVGIDEADQDTLLIEVIDTGVGIPENRIGSLFEPHKPDGGRSARYFNRTGLGLYLCRELVSLFGGDILVKSAVSKGTSFCLSIPTALAKSERIEISEQDEGDEPTRAYGHWRVLIAEDNPVNQHLFREILERAGHAVDVVSNGQEAVAAVQVKEPYDIVLMDIAMPVMDGMEATSLIRSLFGPLGHTPILALTAHAMEGDREIFLNAGMDGYQSKPVNPVALQNAMAEAIASRTAIKRWPNAKAPEQSVHPASGPKSWLRFPKLGRRRESDLADQ